MIEQGRVTVNGRVVRELGSKVDPLHDHVKVDGRHLKPAPPHVYVMLNKPKGFVSTMKDPEGRPTIADFLHRVTMRVFPVGRLDFDSEGLVLLTNHGELAQALLHPRYHVAKTYLVKVKGVMSEEELAQLARGIKLDDGMTGPAGVKKVRKAEANSWIELTIHEGRKHQVKRMCEAVGHPVLKLIRVRLGPLLLGDLPLGEHRFLTDREANALRAILQQTERKLAQQKPDHRKPGGPKPEPWKPDRRKSEQGPSDQRRARPRMPDQRGRTDRRTAGRRRNKRSRHGGSARKVFLL